MLLVASPGLGGSCMRHLSLITALLCAASSAAFAADAPANAVSREQSKIVLDMPGLQGGRELYQYLGWDAAYAQERSYAAQVPRKGLYPRAQVYLTRLAPGRVWTVNKDIDAAFIRGFTPFFKDKAVVMASSGGGGSDAAHRTYRFTVDDVACVFFTDNSGTATGSNFPTGQSGATPWAVTGIYCAAPGAALSDQDVAAVRAGYKIK